MTGQVDDRVDGQVDGGRPLGRAAVTEALIEATIELLVERGVDVSVRTIASRAGVNHGLVHAYFGSKEALLRAAADEVNRRAATELDSRGFPPPDIASRRQGELSKAIARLILDGEPGLFSSHPVLDSWSRALGQAEPSLDGAAIDAAILPAAALALGWALFADNLCPIRGVDRERRDALDAVVHDLVRRVGHLP